MDANFVSQLCFMCQNIWLDLLKTVVLTLLQLFLGKYLFKVSKKNFRQTSMDVLLMSLLLNLNKCFPTGFWVIHKWAFFFFVAYLPFDFLDVALYFH